MGDPPPVCQTAFRLILALWMEDVAKIKELATAELIELWKQLLGITCSLILEEG